VSGSWLNQEKTVRKILLLSSSAVLLAAQVPALAAETSETVVVSATRTEQPLEKTGASISLLTGNDLMAQQTVFLADALAETPGLIVNRVGGAGQTATISLRGAEQGQTVTLIDGIRLNDPSDVSGGAQYGDLLANNTDRIEVLRGPQSTLYGSDAIGGVVNIVTKRGGDSPVSLAAGIEGGSYDSWRMNAAADGTAGDVEYGAAVNYYGTNGISAADSRRGNSEADGYGYFGAAINTRSHLSDTVSIDLRGYYTHAHTDYDDGYDSNYVMSDSSAYDIHALYAGYAGLNAAVLGGRFQNRLALIATTSKRDYYDSAYDTVHLNYAYAGSALRFEYQGIVDIDADTQLSFGAESETTAFDNDDFYSYMATEHIAGHKRISSGYGQLQHTFFDQLTLTGGVRYDSDEAFGSHTSVKLSAAWQVPGWDATLRGNYGNGFKAPTLYQLYSPYSNPIANLKAETAKGWEIGADKRLWNGRITASATYFERHTKNQIDFQSCYSAADAAGCSYRLEQYGYYVNIGRSRARGVEASLQAALSDTLKLSANVTDMSVIDRDSKLDLARRPQLMANAAVTWQPLDGFNLGARVNFTGKRFNDASETTRLYAATTVNLFGDYAIDETWQVYGRIDNLFDDRTERVTYYGTPGISATAGVRLHL
jgi:vitamin B12 transporter